MEYGPGTPHSQCRVPETITSKHGTKHGTLGPGWVSSASLFLSYSFSFCFHWARFIYLESSTRFPVACGAKTYNKEAWGSDKVSRFKHPRARVSSMKLLNHLVFVTTETEPWFENLPRGHINKVNFLLLYWGDTRNCSKNSLVKTRPFTYEETSVKIFPCFLFSIEPQSHQGKSLKAWLKSFTSLQWDNFGGKYLVFCKSSQMVGQGTQVVRKLNLACKQSCVRRLATSRAFSIQMSLRK